MRIDFVSIAHIVALVFDIIALGLIARLVSSYTRFWYYDTAIVPPRISFMLFNTVWTLLVLAYVGLTPVFLTRLYHKMASLALNAVTMVFWFAGSVALADFWGPARSCDGYDAYCGCITAGITFGFFLWAIFTFLTVIDILEAFGRGSSTTSAARKGPHAYPGA